MPKQSRHRELLTKLGFTLIPTPRAARRLKSKSPPSFTSVADITYATEETGNTWMLMGTVDLKPHGFNNMSAKVRAHMEAAGIIKKPH